MKHLMIKPPLPRFRYVRIISMENQVEGKWAVGLEQLDAMGNSAGSIHIIAHSKDRDRIENLRRFLLRYHNITRCLPSLQ